MPWARELAVGNAMLKGNTESQAGPEAVAETKARSIPGHHHVKTIAEPQAEERTTRGSRAGAGIGTAFQSKANSWPELTYIYIYI